MDLIQEYFELQAKVHDHFGYVEDWVNIPMEDNREMYWILDENENGGGEINYYDEPFKDGYGEDGQYYNASIYTQRFLPKWIYRTEDYTMVCMDTHTDGNKFLGIFDNTKEQTGVEPYDDIAV